MSSTSSSTEPMDKTLVLSTIPVISPVPSYLATAVVSDESATLSAQTTIMSSVPAVTLAMLQSPEAVVPACAATAPLTATLMVTLSPKLVVPKIEKVPPQLPTAKVVPAPGVEL